MDQYDRYLLDSHVLRAIGTTLGGAVAGAAVTLPSELAAAALAAWHRDEDDDLASPESARQSTLREHAATLALIGLTVEKRGSDTAGGVSVQLRANLVAEARAAAAGGQPANPGRQ
ncbi:hypothetical protein Ais01nite_71680 [Asanoa ishikariensis]|uniref:Uncharacterized protein n=1 Tax=Asanoa ishikariensis TaxID=137265 RepID=A0A1H3UP85_9ACTN|nr:hypothetical protein [Asanoa ishikariensis]GIF69133.1 hypothetical protein Ais01nite_71680 [Asanoa ishikariensis]SDZ64252.1 hypothetical protein SAMN05421684_7703 [Asanoa ishikariensis]